MKPYFDLDEITRNKDGVTKPPSSRDDAILATQQFQEIGCDIKVICPSLDIQSLVLFFFLARIVTSSDWFTNSFIHDK